MCSDARIYFNKIYTITCRKNRRRRNHITFHFPWSTKPPTPAQKCSHFVLGSQVLVLGFLFLVLVPASLEQILLPQTGVEENLTYQETMP